MSVAPHSGIIDFGTFTPPATPLDGIQGEVPAPLVGQEGYILSASGWVPGGSISGLGTMSTQNADDVAITGGSINGTTIGASSPSTGTFTTLIGGGGSANYAQITGGATTKAVQFQTLGSDSNISMAFQPKGTGAIDLAAGSSGVNISNGGTVTAIIVTTSGTLYTSIPSCAITAPTTAGGVQATATPVMFSGTATTVAAGGTGYTVGDVLTAVGGTYTTQATFSVASVSSGVVTAVTRVGGAGYSVLPSNPVTTTGGTGSGATLNVLWTVGNPTITAAGSGYVEQPTVTFSGGGGSGAAAYATVGSGTVIRSLGTTSSRAFDFNTAASLVTGIPAFSIRDSSTSDSYPMAYGLASTSVLVAQGATNAVMSVGSNGTQYIRFTTNGTGQVEQMRVANTTSAVNYVQVTGAATTGYPTISAQGSDANPGFYFQAKGIGSIRFSTSGANSNEQFRINNTTSAVNYLQATGSATGAAPAFSVAGTDTNIDLSLTPKGTGLVRFGTYTAGILTATGYINIKAADGTTYKLLVST